MDAFSTYGQGVQMLQMCRDVEAQATAHMHAGVCKFAHQSVTSIAQLAKHNYAITCSGCDSMTHAVTVHIHKLHIILYAEH